MQRKAPLRIQYTIGSIHDSEMMKCHKTRRIKRGKVSDIHSTGTKPLYNAAIFISLKPFTMRGVNQRFMISRVLTQ